MTGEASPVTIAMWSGPRNISTAMMRAFENRADCAVWDEPLYAYYLQTTGVDHPGRDAVIRAGETDWRRVVAQLLGPVPGGKGVFYQKHMTHHLLPEVGWDWFDRVRHGFLIRDPYQVLRSYHQVRGEARAEDIGLHRQWQIFDHLCQRSGDPLPVVDTGDFLHDPRRHLEALCRAFAIPFTERMLHWPAGRRDSDGVWGEYWYHGVWRSTGFAPPPKEQPPDPLPPGLERVLDQCRPVYQALRAHRLAV
ncbi:MAG: HAD family hydrolase [Candidatus Competibacterales bacterium]